MSDENEPDDAADIQRQRFEYIQEEFIRPRLNRAEKIYNQALTSLWVGNAGASIATLSFIAGTWRDGNFPHVMLWPLSLFVLGLISMGAGALAALITEGTVLHQMERVDTVWDMKIGDLQSPSEHAGLTFQDWRTRAGLFGGLCFVTGCFAGLWQLFCSN